MKATPISQIIRIASIGTGTTMYQMSKALGLKPSEIFAIEVGRAPMPPDFLEKVADFLKEKHEQSARQKLKAAIDTASFDDEEKQLAYQMTH